MWGNTLLSELKENQKIIRKKEYVMDKKKRKLNTRIEGLESYHQIKDVAWYITSTKPSHLGSILVH